MAILIILFSLTEEYVTAKWQDPTALYGVTSYGKDSYRMFCVNEWKQVYFLSSLVYSFQFKNKFDCHVVRLAAVLVAVVVCSLSK